VVGTKRIEGVAPAVETGTPLAKVTVIDVALLITPDVLVTPEIITTTSFPLVGKSVPTISIVVVVAKLIEVTDGELEFYCSYRQFVLSVKPQLYLVVP
jgi:hypothetical protein